MGELRNTPLRLKRDGYMGQVVLIYIRWIINLISQIWYTWCHAMASWQMCQLCANTFVLVFGIMNTSGRAGSVVVVVWVVVGGLVLVWVVFLLLLTQTHGWEQLRCSPVHTMCICTWVSICAPSAQQQQCGFAATWWYLPACWGLCTLCGQHTKGSGMAGVAYVAPGKLWGPLECPQWWLHAP